MMIDPSAVPGPQSSIPAPGGKADTEKLRDVARNFESIFLDMLMKSMRTTIHKSEILGGGSRGEEVFTSMLDQKIGERAGRHGRGLGIADMIVKHYGRRAGPSGTRFDSKDHP
jgi:flagellar protein FlgJ